MLFLTSLELLVQPLHSGFAHRPKKQKKKLFKKNSEKLNKLSLKFSKLLNGKQDYSRNLTRASYKFDPPQSVHKTLLHDS